MRVPEARATDGGLFAPLRHREFALMWGGFLVSHVGDSVQVHAQAWLVTELTRSGFKVGMVAMTQALPRFVLGLFAGVIVDRFDRRRLLFVTQSLAMLQSLVFFALVVTGKITYGAILVLAGALGVFDTLNLTARVAMLPTLVPRPLIGKAIALQAVGVNVVQIAGPSTAALLIGIGGVSGCLATNAATFVVLLVALAFMRPTAPPGAGTESFGKELHEGLAFVRQRPLLWSSILLAYLLGFFGVSAARLLALYARVVIGTNGRGYGFLAAGIGVGAILASVLVTARATPDRLPRNIVAGAFGFTVALGALSVTRHYLPAVLVLMAMGAGQMAFRSAVTTSIQLETPDRMRGRLSSLLALDFALWSFGAVLTGALSDRLAFARARRAGIFVHDATQLPDRILGSSLGTTLAIMAGVCLIATLSLTRTILRARLSRTSEPGHHGAAP